MLSGERRKTGRRRASGRHATGAQDYGPELDYGHDYRQRPWYGGRSGLRWSLLGLGVTGAGLAAVVIAVAVGIGQFAGSGPACAAVLSAAQAAGAARAASVSGIATHYVLQGGGGNCSYAGPPADGLFVALSPSEYNAAGACGGYIQVSGPDGSVRVKIIDQCPECKTGHLDLSEPAFARLAPLKAGLINISYSYLANPALPGPISIIVKPGSSQYWLSLIIDNTGNPLASVAVSTSSGGWESLDHASYNAWNSANGPGPGPYKVRITDTQGHQVTVSGITLSPGSQETTSAWMYGAGSTTGTVNPPPQPSPPPTPSAPATSGSATPSASTSRRPSPSVSPTGVPSGSPSARPRAAASSAVPLVQAAATGTTTPGC
jgi:expansin